ncbi:hypothetical protein HG531_012992 [Fusarium graminearum]|nr:hypothetical protein HG531_012992 [Fusarium graminearum]
MLALNNLIEAIGLLLHHISQLIEELDGLGRACNPCRGADTTCLKVVGACTQELIAYVQSVLAANSAAIFLASKPLLANSYTPALVTNINKHVVAAVESTEWWRAWAVLRWALFARPEATKLKDALND